MSTQNRSPMPPTWGRALGWLVFFVVASYGYVVGVIGAVKAWQGVEWAYPVNLHLVSG